MWKPTNQPATSGRPAEPERPSASATTTPVTNMSTSEPASMPRPVATATSTSDQATIGKSLLIKGEVTASESLYIDGRVEGSINLSGNLVTIVRNLVVASNLSPLEICVPGT